MPITDNILIWYVFVSVVYESWKRLWSPCAKWQQRQGELGMMAGPRYKSKTRLSKGTALTIGPLVSEWWNFTYMFKKQCFPVVIRLIDQTILIINIQLLKEACFACLITSRLFLFLAVLPQDMVFSCSIYSVVSNLETPFSNHRDIWI